MDNFSFVPLFIFTVYICFRFSDYLSKSHEKYGSIVRLWLGPTQLLVSVKDPILIKEMLIKAKDKLPLTGKAFRLAFGQSSLFVPSFEKVNTLWMKNFSRKCQWMIVYSIGFYYVNDLLLMQFFTWMIIHANLLAHLCQKYNFLRAWMMFEERFSSKRNILLTRTGSGLGLVRISLTPSLGLTNRGSHQYLTRPLQIYCIWLW